MYFLYDLLERCCFWFILANSESSSHESLTRESNSDDFNHFPPLPPVEISSLELPPKKHTETHQANNELRSGPTALQLQLNSSEEKTNGIHPIHGVNGMIKHKPNGDKSIPPPAALLSPTKEPPPVLAKPKLWVFFNFFLGGGQQGDQCLFLINLIFVESKTLPGAI